MTDDSDAARLPALANDATELLQLVWEELDRTSNWPTFEAIDRTLLSRDADVDLAELIGQIPPLFMHGGRPQGGARADPAGRLSLTVAGVIACANRPGTHQVLEVVVTGARLGADSYRKGDPALPVEVTFDQVLEELELDLPEDEKRELGRRSAMLLSFEPWTSSSSNNDGLWTYSVDRDIRFYRDVTTIEQYWHARQRQEAAQQRAESVGSPGPQPTDNRLAGALRLGPESPSQSGTPTAERTSASSVTTNHFHGPSNVAINSTDVRQSIKSPKKYAEDSPQRNHPEPAVASVPDSVPSPGSSPIVVFVVAAIGLFGVVPAVIQATHQIWAQITATGMAVCTALLLALCGLKWNRWPRFRTAGLVTAAVLALGIAAVLIVGNASA
ncbi:hypothetical protein [Kribbella catacumbae]|uniref:hypothetical protein n=1 Tax=Kribbella catacumbae TaxID=460086 RepID=UPI000373B49A|nr:hypothetical protein [Kribbella catacumbae]